MTLNTARKIETTFNVARIIMMLPFALVIQILEWLIKLFSLPIDGLDWIAFKVGHRLMHVSDAVKDGSIRNPDCLKHYTARQAWEFLMEEKARITRIDTN